MASRKLLIAEGTEECRRALAEVLAGEYHIRTCSDGEEALQLLRSFGPDVMILDLMLPQIDGITLLQLAREEVKLPPVLAVSRFSSDYISQALGRLGVDYVMRKPCSIRALVARVRDLDQHHGRRSGAMPKVPEGPAATDPGVLVTNILLSMGFKSSHDGYKYLREAILIMAKNPNQPLTKELYPQVAGLFQRDGGNVERSCRTAIGYALENGDKQVWRTYFTADANGVIAKPTNGAFITRMVEVLRTAEFRLL